VRDDTLKGLGVVALILILVGLALAGPWFTILALNTLFGLAIPVNLSTWASAFWLSILVYGASKTSSKS